MTVDVDVARSRWRAGGAAMLCVCVCGRPGEVDGAGGLLNADGKRWRVRRVTWKGGLGWTAGQEIRAVCDERGGGAPGERGRGARGGEGWREGGGRCESNSGLLSRFCPFSWQSVSPISPLTCALRYTVDVSDTTFTFAWLLCTASSRTSPTAPANPPLPSACERERWW